MTRSTEIEFVNPPVPSLSIHSNIEKSENSISKLTKLKVIWPLNGSEAGGDLVLIQNALFV